MKALTDLRRLFRNFRRRATVEGELEAEVQAHLELLTAEKLREGLEPEEARRAARIELGGVEQVKEEVRAGRAGITFEQCWQDVRFGARQLRRNPGFTLAAVLTLALGIGANTAIFSAADALLLRRLPIPDSNRMIFAMSLREGFDPQLMSFLDYVAFRERSHSFLHSGLAKPLTFNLAGRSEPEAVPAAAVEADYLAALGVAPILGQAFSEAEDRPGGKPVALVSYGFWQRWFGGAADVVGRPLNLDGQLATVIGVMPPSFDYPGAAEIWVPLQADFYSSPLAQRASHGYEMVARLKPGFTVRDADAELNQIARDLEKEYPAVRRGWSARAVPLRWILMFDPVGRVEKSLIALAGAVSFLLLLCCANVAGLLLARGVGREREVALRRALGAGPWRIVRQLVSESLLLALLGGAGGLLLAYVLLPALAGLNPVQVDGFSGILRHPSVDARALSFAAIATALAGVLSGVVPAIKTGAAKDLAPVILEGGARSGRGVAGRRWLAFLVVSQIAMAVALLSGGALILQSFHHLQRVDLGFRPENLLTLHVELSAEKYREFSTRVSFVDRVIERLRKLPGVASAGITNNMPLAQSAYDSVFAVEGRPPANPSEVPITSHRVVSPEYLQTIGVTLIKGRWLDEHDRAGTQPVAVVTEEFARQAWPGEEPIGRRIQRVRPGQDFPWMTVVGVVKDVKEDRFNFRISRPVWYLPFSQQENSYALDLVVRSAREPAVLAREIRQAVQELEPDQPVSNVQTMDENLAGLLSTDRFSAILMAALAAMGLLLAVIGLYGIMAYTVGQRTSELGLRAALGARPADILRMVLSRGAVLAGAGLCSGLIGAAFLTRYLGGILYGVKPNDPATLAGVSLLLAAVALAACYFPARRAARVDPMIALRHN